MSPGVFARGKRRFVPAFDTVEGRVLCTGFAVTVPGTANPYLADPANSTGPATATDGTAPPSVNLAGFDAITFGVGGQATYYPFDEQGSPRTSPDGGPIATSYFGARGRIGPWGLPITALAGVFLGAGTSAAPGASGDGVSASESSPQIGQVFFIGDGLTGTGTGARQVVHVPAGASRLYLAVVDGYEWGNNGGAYEVAITASTLKLRLATSQVDLLDPVSAKISAGRGERATAPRLEFRPAGTSTWIAPPETNPRRFTPRIAGVLEVRATAMVHGARVSSAPVRLTVQFPLATDIQKAPSVRRKFDDLWAMTKAFSLANKGAIAADGSYPDAVQEEFGMYISLETATGRYRFDVVAGDAARLIDTRGGESITPPPPPEDVVAPGGRSAVYLLAFHHTHPGYPFAPNLLYSAPGPSGGDLASIGTRMVGFVEDYEGFSCLPATKLGSPCPAGKYVVAGHPLNAPSFVVAYGLKRRPLPT